MKCLGDGMARLQTTQSVGYFRNDSKDCLLLRSVFALSGAHYCALSVAAIRPFIRAEISAS